jgi:hypothetical protein
MTWLDFSYVKTQKEDSPLSKPYRLLGLPLFLNAWHLLDIAFLNTTFLILF